MPDAAGDLSNQVTKIAKCFKNNIAGDNMAHGTKTSLTKSFFLRPVDEVAQDLIGCMFSTSYGNQLTSGLIIETEAYDEQDAAAHCYTAGGRFSEQTKNHSMMLEGGCVYIYEIGSGCCLNFTTGRAGFGSAVLIRAIKPELGLEIMRLRRRSFKGHSKQLNDDVKFLKVLSNGPANLCDSFGISDLSLDRAAIADTPFQISKIGGEIRNVQASRRIGVARQLAKKSGCEGYDAKVIQQAVEKQWRWTAT